MPAIGWFGVFANGDAKFYGSTGAIKLNPPIVAMLPSEDGAGYRFIASDGGVFCYGDAVYEGNPPNYPNFGTFVAITR